jgi:hypothetical protein
MMAMPPLDAALRLKNGPCEDDGLSHNHDPRGSAPLHLKNDFAVHDFVEIPQSALLLVKCPFSLTDVRFFKLISVEKMES